MFADEAGREAHVDEWARACLEGPQPADGTPRLFLLGDSHAGALATALLSGLKRRMSVRYAASIGGFDTYLPNGSYAAGARYITSGDAGITYYLGKRAYTKAAWAALGRALRAGDVVASVTAELRFALGGTERQHVLFLRELQRLVASRNASLLLFGDVLELRWQGRLCATRPEMATWCATPTSYKDQAAIHARVMAALTQLAADGPSTHVFDLRPLLCHGDVCGAFLPGTSRNIAGFVDHHHISSAGALYLAPFINCFMESKGLLPPEQMSST